MAVKPSLSTGKVLQFKPGIEADHDDVAIAVAPRHAPLPETEAPKPAVDLAGRPKVIFLAGRGATGKTTLARWLSERGQAEGRPAVLAALDPVNRTLSNYFEGVAQPESSNPQASARWLRHLLSFALENRTSVIVDLGGGDTAFGTVLTSMPDLPEALDAAGMAAVALYTLGPRIDDIAAYISLDFRPPATAFIFNEGLADPNAERRQPFQAVLRQSPVRSALEAGAQAVWMPRMDSEVVSFVERKRMSFGAASRGEKGTGPFAAFEVRNWLRSMDQALAGISSWLV